MDCAQSIALLSDFHDGALTGTDRKQVQAHLAECQPCAGVFEELDVIVLAASALNVEPGIAFPDETVFWQRMEISRRPIH
jgi:predicted anti-sigma-YlaC factor YlaD